MKKLWEIINKIDIKVSTLVFIILATLLGQLKPVLLLFLIAIIHELFHLLMCLVLKVKINRFTILPFGANLEIEGVEQLSSIKQCLIYIAGPLSVFFNLIWIHLFFKSNFIHLITFNYLLHYNLMMCILNLLPIFPLDGYMIIKSFLQLKYPYKKSLKISIITSIIFFILFIIYNIFSPQLMITIFLFFEQIKHVKRYKELYKEFLIFKTNLKRQKKYKIINNYQMYKDVNNYQFEKDRILNDQEIAYKELKKMLNNNKK